MNDSNIYNLFNFAKQDVFYKLNFSGWLQKYEYSNILKVPCNPSGTYSEIQDGV